MAGHSMESKNINVESKSDSAKIKSHLITLLQKSNATPFRRHDGKYQCFYCPMTFSDPPKLREHSYRTHRFIDFETSLEIWMAFDLQSNLLLDIFNLGCTVCGTNVRDLNYLKIHYSEWHDEMFPKDVFNCVLSFNLSQTLRCQLCKKIFVSFEALLHHMRTSEHLICESCGSSYNNKSDLIEHDETNCKPCTYCNLRFDSKTARDTHLKIVHCKGFDCDFCSRVFTKQGQLAKHIRNLHYKEKNKTCDICGKTFFDNNYLNLHKVSHQNTTPFECDICKKRFVRRDALKLHKRIHSNDRRYCCQICGKTFVQWTSLNMHKVVHSEERNFKCIICDKGFKDKRSMEKHCMIVHVKSDIRDFKCPVCEKAFKDRKTMERHCKNVHNKVKETTEGVVKTQI